MAAPSLDLLIEVAEGGEALVHVPDLPGLAFRLEGGPEAGLGATEDPFGATLAAAAIVAAPSHVAAYLEWLRDRGAADLTAPVAGLAAGGAPYGFRVAETRRGAPLWESGSPAALFERDRRVLDDPAVETLLRVARLALEEARGLAAALAPTQFGWRPGPGRRTVAQSLEHLGNVVWWYASRLDDDWPEPLEPRSEPPGDRPLRLLGLAGGFLRSVPPARRADVHVPRRYPTSDPEEPWTHAKACRREAEHALEHLPGPRRDAAHARSAHLSDEGGATG